MSKEKASTVQQNMAIRLMRILRYNKTRNERVLELMPSEKTHLYYVIPFLLHVNDKHFPGFVDDPETPYGLFHYSFKDHLEECLRLILPEVENLKDLLREIWPKKRWLDSLMLMGSVGTIAQSAKSDFDYWLCINNKKFTEKQLELLQKKLTTIEHWADKEYDLEVHFFISDIEDVRHNRFGAADGESSGSAQAIFLKSEFYTTHIAVAGKASFWWFMPDGTSNAKYKQLIGILKNGETPDPRFFIDLGNLEKMDPSELFGAAIWQITKAIDSPFKSVLKLAKLEVFLENIETRRPLCNTLRKRVHAGAKAPGGLEGVDPYALMFDELINHYKERDNQQVLHLLRVCLYIKCNCQLSKMDPEQERNFKEKIISSYVAEWNWTTDQILHLDDIKNWHFKAKYELSQQIQSFLIKCYRRISSKIDKAMQNVGEADMTVLGRKIDTYYSKKDFKIDYLRSAFDNELYCDTVSICAELDEKLKREWFMYSDNQISKDRESLENVLLKTSFSPIELIIWAVTNRIIDSKSKILLGYKTAPVTEADLYKLTKYASELFPAIRINDIPRDTLLKPAVITRCMAIVNFESRRFKPDLETFRIIYSTSWGEIFVISTLEDLRRIADTLENKDSPAKRYLLLSDSAHKERLSKDFEFKTKMKDWQLL